MFILSAPSLKHKRPRKKCPDKLIMALDLRPNIRLHGIRPLIKYHGDRHQGIKLIKVLGLMHLGSNYLSISGLCSGLHRSSTLEGHRRWKRINTTMSHLSRCRIRWSGWWCHTNNHPQEGRLGSRKATTPWGETDAPSRIRSLCLGFGS
jgi:hypothetical protein